MQNHTLHLLCEPKLAWMAKQWPKSAHTSDLINSITMYTWDYVKSRDMAKICLGRYKMEMEQVQQPFWHHYYYIRSLLGLIFQGIYTEIPRPLLHPWLKSQQTYCAKLAKVISDCRLWHLRINAANKDLLQCVECRPLFETLWINIFTMQQMCADLHYLHIHNTKTKSQVTIHLPFDHTALNTLPCFHLCQESRLTNTEVHILYKVLSHIVLTNWWFNETSNILITE